MERERLVKEAEKQKDYHAVKQIYKLLHSEILLSFKSIAPNNIIPIIVIKLTVVFFLLKIIIQSFHTACPRARVP